MDFLIEFGVIAFYFWIIVQVGVAIEKVGGVLLAVWLLFGFLILPVTLVVWGIRSSG